tara:strand:- start:2142 stop:4652 length:2511 start_codon:yes stop_codon:yes gene_type:complete
MLNDKELKKKYLPIFSKDPGKYYPINVLKEEGFHRIKCTNCQRMFWSTDSSRNICGDPICSPGESFGFIGKSPATNSLDCQEVWHKFSKMFKGFGYDSIKRYPIVARWNPTMDFTNASIAAFQPYVVSGEAKAPSEKIVIPQFCFRTVDIDNVGITGSHNTVFNMIGQHQFVEKKNWDQDEVFREMLKWLHDGMGVSNDKIICHEDSWAGGGNFGSSIEFFVGGLEIITQVYMLYEQTERGISELNLKILDMGMGMERTAWVSQGVNTIYDATFPHVLKKLFSLTGMDHDKSLIQKYVPHAGRLNTDEVDDISKAWKEVADKVGVDVDTLRQNILPLAGVYSVAEHTRALLILLSDGALPSNSGQAYNIRTMLRRALDFIERYGWNVNLFDVCEWHARDLKVIFPELSENLEDVRKILDVEVDKYASTRQKSRQIVKDIVGRGKTGTNDLLRYYDEKGISPELIREEAEKIGEKVEVPGNFYGLVASLHEKIEKKHATRKKLDVELKDVVATEIKYYDDYSVTEFKAKVLKCDDNFVVLDKTYFYPTSGGQLRDEGFIDGNKIVDIVKEGNVMVHVLEKKCNFEKGKRVECSINKERRFQLAQHHTSAHILNAAAKRILGNHINQAGAHKDVDKARLDITHYSALSEKEIAKIEEEANKIVEGKININKGFFERGEAENKYGVEIYQGGAVPGKMLRIVDIPGVDVEACGGTHLNNTSETGLIKILKSSKISDSIVRIEYVAGKAAEKESGREDKLLKEAADILGVGKKGVAIKSAEVFRFWKDIVKKKKAVEIVYSGDEEELSDKEILEKTAHLLKTQIEHVPKTLKRFLDDLEK